MRRSGWDWLEFCKGVFCFWHNDMEELGAAAARGDGGVGSGAGAATGAGGGAVGGGKCLCRDGDFIFDGRRFFVR